jgi:hypothetical protein
MLGVEIQHIAPVSCHLPVHCILTIVNNACHLTRQLDDTTI